MANLVGPVNVLTPVEERIIEFRGLNRNTVIEEGEMADMWNLTSDNYPTLSPRKLRDEMQLPEGVKRPQQIMTKHSKICLLGVDDEDDVHFYYDGELISKVTGLSHVTQMVQINTKVCFFPQKTYLEIPRVGGVITIGDFGSLESGITISNAAVTESLDSATIELPDASIFGYDDAINLDGVLYYEDSGGQAHADVPCIISCVVEDVDTTSNVVSLPQGTFIEMTGEGATAIKFSGTIKRTMPDLDFIIEYNNRLWGASNKDNTIYACKLGDPKNWQYYQGTSLDSYYAQQGTDGLFTGCAMYSSHLIFFKEDSMVRIYGTAPSNYQITNTQCYGVEEGSPRSVVTINDTVFYKSKIGIMAYYGTTPVLISQKFNERMKNAVGGSDGRKYYVSLQRESGGFELYVFDIDRAVWHKEDGTRMRSCSTINNRLYFIMYSEDALLVREEGLYASPWLLVNDGVLTGKAMVVGAENAVESYEDMEWGAVFGPFDEFIENRKIYSRIFLRFIAHGEARVQIYISLDEGEWELVKDFTPSKTGGEMIPIVPRRCDRYSIKVVGHGNCDIKSLTRNVRGGTHGKL